MSEPRAARLPAPTPRVPHSVRCAWFWAWVPVGALGVLGVLALGTLALAPALLVGAVMMRSSIARRSAFGLLSGAGVSLLFIAYVQRDGPGTTCYHTAMTAGCDSHLNPVPWLLIGLSLFLAGFVGQTLRSP